ncbi:MAG: hypothetical protein Q3M30_02130 [Candidatus Electrothrix sp. Rat3]|nr:hypothetical protein [Candidatus Electrothrix rattekaaiensis]
MNKSTLFFGRALLTVAVCSFFFNPSLLLADSGTDKNPAAWQEYNNPKSGFLFTYPTEWELIDDFLYQTAGALSAGTGEGMWTINLQQIGKEEDSANWIRINPRQFQDEDGTCMTVSQQQICTYSRDAGVLAILKKIAASFRLQENR